MSKQEKVGRFIARVISEYRVTIDAEVREALRIHEGDEVSVVIQVVERKEERLR